MTEYWVSRKQYWCKYCSIFIRDDAPSRRSHETGLKHSGNKERFIRDLYKNGNKAKIEKAEEAVQIARIEAAAAGTGATSARLSTLEALRAAAPAHRAREPSRSTDKFANYSSAKDLGFEDEETEKTSYEIEQELKGRSGEVGAWETVDYGSTGYYTEPPEAESSTSGAAGKRKLGEYNVGEEDNHEGFKIQKKKDPYADDEWDPRSAIKGKVKKEAMNVKYDPGLDRTEWTGKLEMEDKSKARGLAFQEGGGWVKVDVEAEVAAMNELYEEPVIEAEAEVKQEPEGSLFKKRRPPPSSRKK